MEAIGTIHAHPASVNEMEAVTANCWLGRIVIWLVHETTCCVHKIYTFIVEYLKTLYELLASYFQFSQEQFNPEQELGFLKKLPRALNREIYTYVPDVLLRRVKGDVERLAPLFQEDLKIIGQKVKRFDVLQAEFPRRDNAYRQGDGKKIPTKSLSLTEEKILNLLRFFPNLEELDLRGYSLSSASLSSIIASHTKLKSLSMSLDATQGYSFGPIFSQLETLELDWLDNIPFHESEFATKFLSQENLRNLQGVRRIKELKLSRLGGICGQRLEFLNFFQDLTKLELPLRFDPNFFSIQALIAHKNLQKVRMILASGDLDRRLKSSRPDLLVKYYGHEESWHAFAQTTRPEILMERINSGLKSWHPGWSPGLSY